MHQKLIVIILTCLSVPAFANNNCKQVAQKAAEKTFAAAHGGSAVDCQVEAEHVNLVYVAQCQNDDDAVEYIINTINSENGCALNGPVRRKR